MWEERLLYSAEVWSEQESGDQGKKMKRKIKLSEIPESIGEVCDLITVHTM